MIADDGLTDWAERTPNVTRGVSADDGWWAWSSWQWMIGLRVQTGCLDSGRVSDRITPSQPERRPQSRAAQPARCVRTLDGEPERRLSGVASVEGL